MRKEGVEANWSKQTTYNEPIWAQDFKKDWLKWIAHGWTDHKIQGYEIKWSK